MVCEKCEKKLKHVVTADPWKMAGRTSDSAGTSAGRKVNENKVNRPVDDFLLSRYINFLNIF